MIAAHTPTLFASVALVATTMAICLIVAGQLKFRDGLFTTGCGLFAHSFAYVCYTLYGHAPLWLTYGVGNSLLSVALAFYALSIFRIRGLPTPWVFISSLPLLMVALMAVLIDTREARMLASSTVLSVQCLLIMIWAYRNAQPSGRAHGLLIVGASISLVGLLMRVVAILAGVSQDMQYDVSNLKQTISVAIGTATVMMFSLGLVLLSKERSESKLHHMALRDALTGMLNRRAILERLSAELERARRAGSSLAVAMIDIDHFKQINDRYGHLAGDEVLCHCVRHLSQRLRASDSIGRYGGEEFLLLLPDTTADNAMAVVDELRRSMAETPAQFGNLQIPLSFSAGLWCAVPGPADTADSLIGKADVALYEAKLEGRNTLRLLSAYPREVDPIMPDELKEIG